MRLAYLILCWIGLSVPVSAATLVERRLVVNPGYGEYDAQGAADIKITTWLGKSAAKQTYEIVGPYALRKEKLIHVIRNDKQFLCMSDKTSMLFDLKQPAGSKLCYPLVTKIEPSTPIEKVSDIDIKITAFKTQDKTVAKTKCKETLADWKMISTGKRDEFADLDSVFRHSFCEAAEIRDPFSTGTFNIEAINSVLLDQKKKPLKTNGLILGSLSAIVPSFGPSLNGDNLPKDAVFTVNSLQTMRLEKTKPPKGIYDVANEYQMSRKTITLSEPMDTILVGQLANIGIQAEVDRMFGNGSGANLDSLGRGVTPPQRSLGIGAKPSWTGTMPRSGCSRLPASYARTGEMFPHRKNNHQRSIDLSQIYRRR